MMQLESFHWLSYHMLWAIIPCSTNFSVVLGIFFYLACFLHFWGIFNKTIIPLALVGYEMIKANEARSASLAIYYLISNTRSWNNCQLLFIQNIFPFLITITSCCSPNLERIFTIFNQWLQKWSPPKIIKPMTSKWRQKCSPPQIIEPLTEKTWGQGCVIFGERKNKERNGETP